LKSTLQQMVTFFDVDAGAETDGALIHIKIAFRSLLDTSTTEMGSALCRWSATAR
jgi:hypothetical protein